MAANAFFESLSAELNSTEDEILRLLKTLGSAFKTFLPASVSIQTWAERRIPREDLEEVNAGGLIYVPLDRASATTTSRIAKPPAQPLRWQSPALATDSSKRRKVELGTETSDFNFDAFLAVLPEEGFTPEEDSLRQRVIHCLLRRRAAGRLSKLPAAQIAEAPTVAQSLEAFHLPGSQLDRWVSSRIGCEVFVSYDEQGGRFLELAPNTKLPHRGSAEAELISEEFFGSLPDDSFTPDEEILRSAMYTFLRGWTGRCPPTLSVMSQASPVSNAKHALLPKGISLKEWCETRVADEFELAEAPSGQYAVGLRGHLNLEAVAEMRKHSGAHRTPDGVHAKRRAGTAKGKGKTKGGKGKS